MWQKEGNASHCLRQQFAAVTSLLSTARTDEDVSQSLQAIVLNKYTFYWQSGV